MAVYSHDLAAIILLPALAAWLIDPQGLKSATRSPGATPSPCGSAYDPHRRASAA